jgi:hypothetical protein
VTPAAARADGELSVRAAYYKERSTRVAQPMLDARLDVGASGELTGHLLVDAITSASAAAGASGTAFTERRYEAGAGYSQKVGEALRLGASGRYSYEPDYQSLFGGVRAVWELAQRNTELGLFAGAGRDAVSNAGVPQGMSERIEGSLRSYLASLSLSQVLTPTLVASFTCDLSLLDGFQENPYRPVPAGGIAERERVPDERRRTALRGAATGYLEPTRSVLIAAYRLYLDDWGLIGHTPELRVVQDLGQEVDLHLRYRYHRQNSADFFKPVYDTADPSVEPYLTADEKLSAMDSHSVAVKLDTPLSFWGASAGWSQTRAEALISYTLQSTSFGNAISAQLAITFPLSY